MVPERVPADRRKSKDQKKPARTDIRLHCSKIQVERNLIKGNSVVVRRS